MRIFKLDREMIDTLAYRKAGAAGFEQRQIQSYIATKTAELVEEFHTEDGLKDLFVMFAAIVGFEHPDTAGEMLDWLQRSMRRRVEDSERC